MCCMAGDILSLTVFFKFKNAKIVILAQIDSSFGYGAYFSNLTRREEFRVLTGYLHRCDF